MHTNPKFARATFYAASALGVLAFSTCAQAQALQPAVDVCTGISLDPSAVTDIVGVTVQPISNIENTVNSLIDLTVILNPLLNLPDLNSDLSSVLQSIADGDQIALTVLDTEGNLITSSDACNVAADGYTLNQEAGIAIGGNAITGLGANGLTASAAEIDAIALGNNASTDAGAFGAVAIGTGASVTMENSVAIGAGSMAIRGAETDYVSPGLAGTWSSAGEFSVGAVGSERKITNVAPGSELTDAATVGQVQGALDALAALDDASVQYDDGTYASVTLLGASGTTITNVAAGTLDAASTDAVNGSQLYATNLQVQANTDAIDGLDTRVSQNETDISNLDDRVTINEGDIANLDNRVTINEGDIANLDASVTNIDARVTDNSTAITNLQVQVGNVPVTYVDNATGMTPSSTPTQTVAFVGATSDPVRVTNVQAGTLSSTSLDAVNGSQLYATNQQVQTNTDAIAQNTQDITNLQNNVSGSTVVAIQYSDASDPTHSNGGTITQHTTLVGQSADLPVALHNVAAGYLANDAVNLQQLQDGMDAAIASSNAYTDARIAELGFDLKDVRRSSYAGTAGALAVAGLPQVIESDGRMMAGAIGHYRGETAFALGYSGAFNDGRAVFKFNGTVDTHGYAGISTGAGFAF
ncbi:YadA family autotransporter adhesin [Croceicoccus bisphenolivorans]|uniref:YadA family autotransporter adhesin n=1 Tax=Croceicoccus bisphenolivorans TaxID=1783232 RepID=UPI00082C3961|nr:YadA-like family protein [Croceicoccus bisphenolivorans]